MSGRAAIGAIALAAAWLAAHGPVWAQPADSAEEVVASDNDPGGYVPTAEPAAFALGGYLDVGFADVTGDGTSFHPDDRRLPIDYAADPFATAVNTRGDVASADTRGRLSNGFVPRSVGIGGRPSFLLNTLALELRRGSGSDPVLVFARVHLAPRLEPEGNVTRLFVEQAFGRVQPFDAHELLLFVGKLDSVFGSEYLENQSPFRVGVTPSLLARYTTGTSVGGKLFYRIHLPVIFSALSLNVSATNSPPFVEALQPPDASLTGRLALAGRLGHELNLPGVQLKLGASLARGARNDQSDPDTGARLFGLDVRLNLFGLALAGEYLRLDEDRGPNVDKTTGLGRQLVSSSFHVRGFWAQLAWSLPFSSQLFRRTFVYARGEQRRGWFEGFADVRERRYTVGVRLDLGESVAFKAETLLNREHEGAPDVENDVRTASLVWVF